MTGTGQPHQVQQIFRGAKDYPATLKDLSNPPRALFRYGPLWPVEQAAIAIVGARAAGPYGLEMSSQLAGDLARSGVTVVSGMARGVDQAAHRGALEVGGKTIAVLPTNPAMPIPADARELHATIARRGLLLSEYGAGTRMHKGLFVRRNRIMAALALGVVVIEAGVSSGALITARWAKKLGRFVAVVPGDVTRESSLGCLELLRQGAAAVGSAGDVMALFARPRDPILTALFRADSTLEELVELLAMPVSQIQSRLVALEMAGSLILGRDGRYRHRDRISR